MNFLDKFAKWGIDPRKLTNKKQQTNKKIEYVKDYIVLWANISAVRSEISTITLACSRQFRLPGFGYCSSVQPIPSVFQL